MTQPTPKKPVTADQRIRELAEKDSDAAQAMSLPESVTIDGHVLPYSINVHLMDGTVRTRPIDPGESWSCVPKLIGRLEQRLAAIRPFASAESSAYCEAVFALVEKLESLHMDCDSVERYMNHYGYFAPIPDNQEPEKHPQMVRDPSMLLRSAYGALVSSLDETQTLLAREELRHPQKGSPEEALKVACEYLKFELLGPGSEDLRSLYRLAIEEQVALENAQNSQIRRL